MQISDILSPQRIICNADSTSKKTTLEILSSLLASADSKLSQTDVFDCLLSRERLGSTGLGHGIALPHGRLKNGTKTLAAFIKLENGIDFDSIDHQPVDLLFALLVPENSTEEHLQFLARLAEMFSNKELLNKLRTEASIKNIYKLLTQ